MTGAEKNSGPLSISIEETNEGMRVFEWMNEERPQEEPELDFRSFMAGWICAKARLKQ